MLEKPRIFEETTSQDVNTLGMSLHEEKRKLYYKPTTA